MSLEHKVKQIIKRTPVDGGGNSGELSQRTGYLGDSRTQFAVNNAGNIKQWTNWGYASLVREMTQGRTYTEQAWIFGVPSQKTDHFLSVQVPAAIQARLEQVICLIGINDCLSGVTVTVAIANATAGLAALRAAGMRVIWVPEGPLSGAYSLTAAQQQWIAIYNKAMQAFCLTSGCVYAAPVLDVLTDFSTGLAVTNALHDGLHDSPFGAQLRAVPVSEIIKSLTTNARIPQTMLADVYDAATNPGGNLLTNGLLAGVGGTLVFGGTGTAPDSWQAGGDGTAGTLTIATSSVDDPTRVGLKRARQVLGGVANSVSSKLDQTVANAAWLIPGKRVVLEVVCEWSLMASVWGAFARASVIGDGGTYESFDGAIGTTKGLNSTTGLAIFRTEPLLVPTNPSSLRVRLMCQSRSSGSAAGQIDWYQASLRYID